MQTIQLRDAKASLSSVVSLAERGEPTIITRHGQPSAMVVSMEAGLQLLAVKRPSLAQHLLSLPEPVPTQRNKSALRKIDL